MAIRDSRRAVARGQLAALPGVPETRLEPALLDHLPEQPPPAPPWTGLLDAVLWVQRPTPAARATLPPELRRRRGPGVGVAGFVRYHDTPVGSYDEFLASPTLARGGLVRLHLPLIAVDSLPSLHAGRAHWALPKTMARFAGRPGRGDPLEVRGTGWRVSVVSHAVGPALPVPLRVSIAQVWPDGAVGTFAATFRGRVRLARVRVDAADGVSLGRWLRQGTHLGVLLTGARMLLRPAVMRER